MEPLTSLTELFSLKGRTALITGASRGLGQAMARRFAEAGAALVLVDRDDIGLEETKRAIQRERQCSIEVFALDLSNKAQIDELWQTLAPHAPDVLVNNAGIYPFENFLEVTPEALQRVMSINFEAAYWMSQHLIRERLALRKGGTLINLISIEAFLPFKGGLSSYTASKAALLALTRDLAREYGPRGFRVNAIAPGGILTGGVKQAARKLGIQALAEGWKYQQRLPLKRLGQPDDVARVAVALASDLFGYVQGAVLVVDGGFLSA